MNAAEKAILKAIISGTLTELLIKTSAEQVFLDETTTLAAKLTEIIAAINERAKTTDMNTAMAEMKTEIKQELLGDMPVETLNTFTELAKAYTEHEEFAETLQAAIGDKADKNTVEALDAAIKELGALASKDTISESDLDAALKEKINAASQGNHSHENKSVLDGIGADNIAAWDAKANIYKSATQPAGMTDHDLWIQLV